MKIIISKIESSLKQQTETTLKNPFLTEVDMNQKRPQAKG